MKHGAAASAHESPAAAAARLIAAVHSTWAERAQHAALAPELPRLPRCHRRRHRRRRRRRRRRRISLVPDSPAQLSRPVGNMATPKRWIVGAKPRHRSARGRAARAGVRGHGQTRLPDAALRKYVAPCAARSLGAEVLEGRLVHAAPRVAALNLLPHSSFLAWPPPSPSPSRAQNMNVKIHTFESAK